MRAWGLLLAVGCGRIGFDPQSATGDGDARNDGNRDGNGSGAIDAMIDAPTVCATAMTLTLGARAAANTCASGDHIDACGPPGTQEVVFVYTPPSTGTFTMRAYDPGTNNVSNSTQRLDPINCAPTGTCAAVLGTTLPGGTPSFFVVEASSGGCVNIEFEVQ